MAKPLTVGDAAIQLCARKIAAHTGDIRKAFDMCCRGLDNIPASPKSKPKIDYNPLSDPDISSTTFGGSAVSRVKSLNLQEKGV